MKYNYSIIAAIFFNIVFAHCGVTSGINIASIKVASIQYRSIQYKKSENIRILSNLIEKAAINGAKVIVLPEMCTTGLNIKNRAQGKSLSEIIPGPSTDVFAGLTKLYGIYLVFGLPEFDPQNNNSYNSQVIINPYGKVIGKYRKVHLFGSDYNWATKGDLGYQVVETEYGNVGLGICYDINFADMLDYFSGKGVNIFAFSANWISKDSPFNLWMELLKNRNYYFIASNNWGEEDGIRFSGSSVIMAPFTGILSYTDISANIILYADILIRSGFSTTGRGDFRLNYTLLT